MLTTQDKIVDIEERLKLYRNKRMELKTLNEIFPSLEYQIEMYYCDGFIRGLLKAKKELEEQI